MTVWLAMKTTLTISFFPVSSVKATEGRVQRNIYKQAEWDSSAKRKRKKRSGGADYIRPSQISW